MSWLQTEMKKAETLTAEEVEKLLLRYDRMVINLIAYCKERAEQEKLIELWNSPGTAVQLVDHPSDLLYENAR
jgi:hypothetical protein